MQPRGVAIVAYGAQAWQQADECLASIRQHHPTLPVTVASDRLKRFAGQGVKTTRVDSDPLGRRAKLTLLDWAQYSQALYLDADTRLRGDVAAPFALLSAGWDMAITLSKRQGPDVLGNLPEAERIATITPDTLGLQAGVFYVARNERTLALFGSWLAEWSLLARLDQGALVRAYRQNPVRLWLLGRPYNDGELVEHHYGAAARRL